MDIFNHQDYSHECSIFKFSVLLTMTPFNHNDRNSFLLNILIATLIRMFFHGRIIICAGKLFTRHDINDEFSTVFRFRVLLWNLVCNQASRTYYNSLELTRCWGIIVLRIAFNLHVFYAFVRYILGKLTTSHFWTSTFGGV